MIQDRPTLGIALMLGFCILAPMGDAIAKVLGSSVPLLQVVVLRFAIQLVVLAPFIWITGRRLRVGAKTFVLIVVRTILHVIGIGLMFTALRYLPLADAVAIVFVLPFLTLLLGKYVLKETVGKRRLWACLFGFAGTLLVVQPSFANVGWPAVLPLLVALDFALFMLITRKIAKQTDPVSLQTISGAIAVVVLMPFFLVGLAVELPGFRLIAPQAWQWQLLVAIGLLGTFSHLLMTWSLRYAPSTTLAPMQYLEIPFATILGLIVFKDLPNPLASLGILITITAGLYIIYCERTNSRNLARHPAQ